MASLRSPLDPKKFDKRKVTSSETLNSSVCSSNSSCILQKRKPIHPLAAGVKLKNTSSIKQRVLSAKFLRFKTLQNELNDANFHIAQLVGENKLLKNLQKRHEQALAKYEGQKAELPQVLESHQEEIRSLQTRNKNLRKNNKELSDQLKHKDDEIITLRDQNKYLMSICKNKNLEERDKLMRKVEDLEMTIKERDATITNLNRKIAIETKNCKYKVNAETSKTRYLQKELNKAVSQVDQLNSMIEGHDKSADSRARRNVSNERKKALTLKLSTYDVESNCSSESKKFTVPALSNFTGNSTEGTDSGGSTNSLLANEHNHFNETRNKKDNQSDSSSSEHQLKKMVNNLQKKTVRIENPINENINENSVELKSVANTCIKTVDQHILDFNKQAKETERLISVLKENDEISKKLSHVEIPETKLVYDFTDMFKEKDKNSNHILVDSTKSSTSSLEEAPITFKAFRLNNNNKPEVENDDKEKLLAKLRAIDNGESLEFTNMKKTKNDLIKELFG